MAILRKNKKLAHQKFAYIVGPYIDFYIAFFEIFRFLKKNFDSVNPLGNHLIVGLNFNLVLH